MPASFVHLALRFADVVTSRPLGPAERGAVDRHLGDERLSDLFFEQPVADQRHGLDSALSVLAASRPDLVRAAMLHDIGKRHASLGPLGRTAASLAIRTGIGLTPRFEVYRDHGSLGAVELAGQDCTVVEFARHHHGTRPASIAPEDWAVLQRADRPRSLYRRPVSTSIEMTPPEPHIS